MSKMDLKFVAFGQQRTTRMSGWERLVGGLSIMYNLQRSADLDDLVWFLLISIYISIIYIIYSALKFAWTEHNF